MGILLDMLLKMRQTMIHILHGEAVGIGMCMANV